MASRPPVVVIIGGPNGAGKSTVARAILLETLGITEFVNADAIAAGLSAFEPQRAAIAAGRIMLARLRELGQADPPVDFAFESTLASRTFAPWLRDLVSRGYEVHILYVWLRSADLAVRRVRARVRAGGHDVPEDVIRRRYARSAANLFRLYMPIAAAWTILDNSRARPGAVASYDSSMSGPAIYDRAAYALLESVTRES